MRANEIREDKKMCVFLSVIGDDAYKLLKNLVSPTVQSALPYADLVRALNTHYKPALIIIAERFRFQKCNQKKDETACAYVVALRQLAATCNLTGNFSDRLLSEKGLTFPKACEISIAMEMASKGLMEFSGHSEPQQVNALSSAGNKLTV